MLKTRSTEVPAALTDSLYFSATSALTTVNTSVIDYWTGAIHRRATPFSLVTDFFNWTAAISNRNRPQWAHASVIAREWPLARLRDYSIADADPAMIATLVLPPQAGHDSSIVDYAENQSQVIVGRDNGCDRIYALEWVSATHETKDATIDDYMVLLRETIETLGGKVNLVGDCQGGWLATIFAALHPELVNSLTIAGAPIDFQAGNGQLKGWVNVMTPGGDMTLFRSAVKAHDGVLPGRFLLDGFKALQPGVDAVSNLGLLANLDDPTFVERYRKFEETVVGIFFICVPPIEQEYVVTLLK